MLRPRCAVPGLLTGLAAVLSGEAVRLRPSDVAAGAGGGKTRPVGIGKLNKATGCSAPANVPLDIDEFRKHWGEMMWGEGTRIVVGVFSTAGSKDRPLRDAVRSGWMAQKGVCPLGRCSHKHPEANCSLHVTFVVGQGGPGGEETERAEDVTVLPIPEDTTCGRDPAWFQHASTTYWWATHIIKMDIDALPHVPELLDSIRTNAPLKCPNYIGGRTAFAEADPALRGPPLKDDFTRCAGRGAGCWSYMHGGLYLLSAQLARDAAAPGGWWQEESKKCDREDDVLAGKAIYKYAVANSVCVGAVKFKAEREYSQPGR